MANLENLTAKIIADGKGKAEKIIADANREAEAQIAQAEGEAKAESAKILAAAEEEAKKTVELALSAKRIETRDKMLDAKQKTIDRALDEAKKRLRSMSPPAYLDFLTHYLTELNVSSGEVLRVPEAYKDIDMKGLNARLAAAGKPALALDTENFTADGFKLIKGDIENDNSFGALIDYYRVTLEQLVVERLF